MKKALNEYAEVEVVDGVQFVTIDGICIPKIAKTTIEQSADEKNDLAYVTVSFFAKLKNTFPEKITVNGDDLISIIGKKHK